MERNRAIKEIRQALKSRSGKSWSVTGGTGTAWGWITINSLPSRRTMHYQLKFGMLDLPGNWEEVENGQTGGYMTKGDRLELSNLLGFSGSCHIQGELIPSSGDYYQEYVDRSKGLQPSVIGQQYWD